MEVAKQKGTEGRSRICTLMEMMEELSLLSSKFGEIRVVREADRKKLTIRRLESLGQSLEKILKNNKNR